MTGVVVMTAAEVALVAARFLLAAVFLAAGIAKLANGRESIRTLRDFGAPRFVQPLGALLPPLEIAVAAGLLFVPSAWYAAWGALALLGTFTAGIAANLARGHQPACNCFGQFQVRPISWRTLIRNGLLAGCAAWLIVSGRPQATADPWAFLGRLDNRGRRVATVGVALIGFAIFHALRRDEPDPTTPPSLATSEVARPEAAPIQRAAPGRALTGVGLAVGTAAPGFVVPDLEGHQRSLDSLRASGKPVLLLFSSPFCQSCQVLVPKLPGLAAVHEHVLHLVLVSRGSVAQNLEKLNDPGNLPVLLQQDFEVAEAYDCMSTPAAVIVGTDGAIQSRLAIGALAIEQLISNWSVAVEAPAATRE
jgi:thiol-disulfide isomerase/thioredoxin